jgi:hypothetical protein
VIDLRDWIDHPTASTIITSYFSFARTRMGYTFTWLIGIGYWTTRILEYLTNDKTTRRRDWFTTDNESSLFCKMKMNSDLKININAYGLPLCPMPLYFKFRVSLTSQHLNISASQHLSISALSISSATALSLHQIQILLCISTFHLLTFSAAPFRPFDCIEY